MDQILLEDHFNVDMTTFVFPCLIYLTPFLLLSKTSGLPLLFI